MIDHMGIRVTNFAKAKAFYLHTLATLGHGLCMDFEHEGQGHAGFGSKGKPDFWIAEGEPAPGLHVAFAAPDRAAVDAFYAAALEAGGTDNGPPGPRPQYHPGYYGAFVRDLDGYNIEAVCHRPE